MDNTSMNQHNSAQCGFGAQSVDSQQDSFSKSQLGLVKFLVKLTPIHQGWNDFFLILHLMTFMACPPSVVDGVLTPPLCWQPWHRIPHKSMWNTRYVLYKVCISQENIERIIQSFCRVILCKGWETDSYNFLLLFQGKCQFSWEPWANTNAFWRINFQVYHPSLKTHRNPLWCFEYAWPKKGHYLEVWPNWGHVSLWA